MNCLREEKEMSRLCSERECEHASCEAVGADAKDGRVMNECKAGQKSTVLQKNKLQTDTRRSG